MDKTNALSLTGGGMFDGGWTPVWLIKDEFTDTVAAGSVNGTAATPGPGTRTVTDTESKLSVGSGVFAIAGGKASPAWGDPAMWYGGQSRSAGVAAIASIIGPAGASRFVAGWSASTSGEPSLPSPSFYFYNGTIYGTQSNWNLGPFSAGATYKIVTVLRATGALFFIKGGAYENWTLMWIYATGTTSTLYPCFVNYNSTTAIDFSRVLALPAPFDTDDGIATAVLSGSVAAGTTFTHEADCLIEATITTVPSADNIDIVFRQQDASNYWICRIATGGDISLQEVVAGSPTQRGVAAGVVSNGHRVVVIADGTTIKGYSNNVLRWTYSSATNFATATAGEVDALGTGGVVSDLKTWPRTLSGTAASILNKASG